MNRNSTTKFSSHKWKEFLEECKITMREPLNKKRLIKDDSILGKSRTTSLSFDIVLVFYVFVKL